MPTIDDKVVQMTFKNEQFERGVRESLHSLEELKKALDLDKSAESLSNLEKIASSFDISGIAKGIDDIANRFTLVGNLGQEAFRRISSFALDQVHKVTSAITSMPQVGMGKYEQKNKSIQMIQSAMPDKSIEEIEAVLAKLNEYTDLTSYDFSTMANSIGKFVSAGVGLKTAERVMEGIANETASAGGEISQANIAMYNFSQALAAGSVKLMDWRSIQNQNLDTKEFKEEIIKTAIEMGTLGKVTDDVGYIVKGSGKKMKKVQVDYKSFADTLSSGWFTSNVMIKVFEKYADRESEVGKKGFEAAKIAITLTQALDAVKDAISTGWMTSFGYLFGNLEEAGDLFTRISDALIGFAEQIYTTRNEILKGWHDGGKDGISGYQKVIEGLSNSWAVFNGIVEAAKAGFKQVFGVLDSSGLIEASKAFADYTGKIKEFFGVWTETKTTKEVRKAVAVIPKFAGDMAKGMSDSNASKEIEKLQKRLIALKDPLIKLDKYGADGIFGPETEAAIKAFQKSIGLKVTGIYDQQTHAALSQKLYPDRKKIVTETQEDTEEIQHMGKGVELLSKALQGVFSIGKAGLSVIGLGLNIVGQLFNAITPVASGLLSIASVIGNVISYVVELTSAALSGEDAVGGFNSVLAPVAGALQKVGGFLETVAAVINRIIGYLKSGVGLDGIRKVFEYNSENPTVQKYGLIIVDILEKIQNVGKAVKPVFDALISSVSTAFSTIGTWLSGKLMNGLSAVSTFFTNLFSDVDLTSLLTNALNGLATALQVVLGIVAAAGYGIFSLGKAFVEGGIAIFNFVKNSAFVQNFLTSLSEKAKPVREFFQSVWESLQSITGKVGQFESFNDIWTAFMTAMKLNPIGQKFVPALLKARKVITDFIVKIKSLVTSVKKAFGLLKDFGDPSKALGFLSMTRNKDGNVVKILEFFEKIKNVFSGVKGAAGEAKTAVGGFFSNLIPNLKEFGQKLGEMIGGFFSVDTSGIQGLPQKLLERLKAFNPVIDWIKGKFSEIKDFVMDPNKLLSHVVGALKGIGEFVIGIFKNVNLGTIWDTAKTALGMYIMMTFAKSLKSFSESFGILTGAIDKDEKDGFADKLRSIATTIAIVTAAIAGLAFIPAKEAVIGIGLMAAALAVVGGALFAMNKWAPKTKDIGEGVLNMALSIVAVVVAIGLAAAVVNTAGDLTKPLLLVGGIIVALGVAAWAMSRFGKKYTGATKGTAKTILAMCAGVYLVVKAVDKMTEVLRNNKGHEGSVIQALIVVVGMLAALGTVAVLMSKYGSGGEGEGSNGVASTILAMCMSLDTIIRAIGNVANLIKQYPDNWGWAFGVVEVMLGTIGAISILLAKFSGEMDWKVSLMSAAPILAMGWFLDTIVKTLAEAIPKVAGVDPGIIEQFLVGIAEAVTAMVGTVAIFSKIGLSGLAKAAAGIVLIMGAIGVGVDLVATFAADAVEKLTTAMRLVGWRLSGFSDDIQNVDGTKIQQAMNVLTNTIIPAIVNLVANSSVIGEGVTAAANVWLFGEALGLFQRSISGITVDTGTAIKQLPVDIKETVDGINAIQGIDDAKEVLTNLGGALALYYGDLAKMNGETPTDENGNFDINKANEAFGNLADLTLSDETIKKIQSYATGGENDLNNFAIGIENLGTALSQYGTDISNIKEDDVTTANKILDKVKDIDDYINPMTDVDYNVLNGKRKSISEFGLDVAALGRALASYSDNIAGLNPGKVLMANVVLDAVATLASRLPTTGGLWQMLAGEQKLGEFAANMADLGTGMANYANKVAGADFKNVDASTAAVRGLAAAQSVLQSYGGLKSIVSGTAGLDKLGANLVGLGKSLVSFATDAEGIKKLKDADFELLKKAIEPIKGLAEAQSILQREGGFKEGFEGSASLSNLGTGLANFGNSLNTFKANIEAFDFDDTKFVSAIDLLSKIVSLQEIVQNGDPEWNFKNAGENMALMFDAFANAILNDTEVTEALGAALQVIQTTIIENTVTPATTWGSDLVTNFATGMQNNIETAENAAAAIARVIWSYLHFSKPEVGPLADADTYGGDMIDLLADGITGNKDAIEQAVGNITSTISDSFGNMAGNVNVGETIADNVTGSQNIIEQAVDGVSSMVSEKFGETAGNGITNLLNGMMQSSSEDLGGKIKDGISQAFNGLFGGADNPVITPVVDLTNVDDAANYIQNNLNGGSIGVGANLAANVASGNGSTIIQAGTLDIPDHSPEIISAIQDLGERIVSLETQTVSIMSNLRVVMNTNALVGQIAPAIDRALGNLSNRA